MSGFILVYRDIFEHPIAADPERFKAWLWLISQASHEATTTWINGKRVPLERGQLSYSTRFLAEKFGWERTKVRRFLDYLEAEKMIVRTRPTSAPPLCPPTAPGDAPEDAPRSAPEQTVITICNYDKYQRPPRKTAPPSAPPSAPGDAPPTAPAVSENRPKEERTQLTNESSSKEGGEAPPLDGDAQSATILHTPRAIIFNEGRQYLQRCGMPEGSARSFLAAQSKKYGDGALIEVISDAMARGVQEPKSWIVAALKARRDTAAPKRILQV